jgi:putative transposase
MTISKELLDELLKGIERPEDLLGDAGLMKELKIKLMERMLGAELTAHLGYEDGKDAPPGQSNRRNGTSSKVLKGPDGEMSVAVPRDRDSSFEPELVKKGQTRIDGMDDKIIGLYAAGLTVRDIQAHLLDLYGLKVSPDLISRVTDAVLDEVREWQSRALERMYPIVIFDALRVKIRDADSRTVKNKAVYVALGVTRDGLREVLGLWIAENEGAKFWLSVMNELKNRGTQDILIAVVDGLKGFPEAITAAFPQAMVQTCIVHLVRHSLNFCSWKDRKAVAADLRRIYSAPTADMAEAELDSFEEKWAGKYASIAPAWRRAKAMLWQKRA